MMQSLRIEVQRGSELTTVKTPAEFERLRLQEEVQVKARPAQMAADAKDQGRRSQAPAHAGGGRQDGTGQRLPQAETERFARLRLQVAAGSLHTGTSPGR